MDARPLPNAFKAALPRVQDDFASYCSVLRACVALNGTPNEISRKSTGVGLDQDPCLRMHLRLLGSRGRPQNGELADPYAWLALTLIIASASASWALLILSCHIISEHPNGLKAPEPSASGLNVDFDFQLYELQASCILACTRCTTQVFPMWHAPSKSPAFAARHTLAFSRLTSRKKLYMCPWVWPEARGHLASQ